MENHARAVILLCRFAREVSGNGADNQRNQAECGQKQMRKLISWRRPHVYAQSRIEKGAYQNAKHRAFDQIDAKLSPPQWRLARNIVGRKMADVERFHGATSTGRFGQNQPSSANPVRTDPHTMNQLLNTDPAKPMLTAIAVRKGQMLGPGSTYR